MTIEKDIKQKNFKNPYNKLTVNLMYTNGWLTNQYAQILKPYQLSTPQYNVLKILQQIYPEPANINFIIERMVDKMSNVSRLVDKLIAKQLVVKVKSTEDLRSVNVALTANGTILLKELNQKIIESEANFIRLNDAEINLLNILLEKTRNSKTINN
ncbi:MarR family transcriptional regulator [Arcicella sp. LKC2W]|uniref:MarR family winged helix-turn-helix transcriptional regulator n=1 Tax=Arcicella sp. LKC2W TaxID=2984198 RepID=UPI002B204BB9|nr:MarR family transcriptional regulator [Arcicella sp. LKC2W]MEA5459776.1 MarR family transcriptional regulator [Arcicella sp. LKC2W]